MIDEKSIGSIADFTSILNDMSGPNTLLWFRGVGKDNYQLSPSLYRHPSKTVFDDLQQLERGMLTAFRHRSPPFVRGLPNDELELLFLMQHHGIPTRLLDWTENPFVALFFALEAVRNKSFPDTDAAVWILNPTALNKVSLSSFSHEGILSADDDLMRGYRPMKETRTVASDPVALYGVHNSQRIVAQRGVFVLFGKNTRPLETIDRVCNEDGILTKVTVPNACRRTIFNQLFSMGITDSVLFPDLDGLAVEIKTRHGFDR